MAVRHEVTKNYTVIYIGIFVNLNVFVALTYIDEIACIITAEM